MMRNLTACPGVYGGMLRVPLFLVCSIAALAQPQPAQQDPMDAAIQAVWNATNQARFEEMAALREAARSLLLHAPADPPRFAGWAERVAQTYQDSGFSVQARAVLEEALARTAPLGDAHPSHSALVITLGNFWQQDGNLLKAAAYLEQGAAEEAASPPRPGARVTIGIPLRGRFAFGSGSAVYEYIQLARLYQQLGRPDAVAAVAVKIRSLAANDKSALAQFYEDHGPLEEAAAIYKAMAEQAENPQAKISAWQSLGNLYARQERYTDAIEATQQAIAAVPSSDDSGLRNQSFWLHRDLASYMNQAGLRDQADQVYRQLRQDNAGGAQEAEVLGAYAQYLAGTERGAQGESLLQNYLGSNPNLDTQQKMSVLYNLSNVARAAGDSKSADEYQQAGQGLQPPAPEGLTQTGEEWQKVQAAISEQRWNDVYGMALRTIDIATSAADRGQVVSLIPQIATALAANQEPAKVEQLFRRLLALAQDWSVATTEPLTTAAQSYVGFLLGQPERAREVPAAIDHFQKVLLDGHGPDSGALAQALRMKIDFERSNEQWENAEASARDLLELRESLSGDSSVDYLEDLEFAAAVYVSAGDSVHALPLLRRAITIADLVATPFDDWRRSRTRMDAAFALARLGQFDEAETLAEEAVALARPPRTPAPPLLQELQQIRQMKQAAAFEAASRDQQ